MLTFARYRGSDDIFSSIAVNFLASVIILWWTEEERGKEQWSMLKPKPSTYYNIISQFSHNCDVCGNSASAAYAAIKLYNIWWFFLWKENSNQQDALSWYHSIYLLMFVFSFNSKHHTSESTSQYSQSSCRICTVRNPLEIWPFHPSD